MVPVNEEEIVFKGKLGPGDIIGVNLKEGKLYEIDPGSEQAAVHDGDPVQLDMQHRDRDIADHELVTIGPKMVVFPSAIA